MTAAVPPADVLAFDVSLWQDDLLEVSIDLERAARTLAKIGLRYTREQPGMADVEPGPFHLAWEVSEAAIIGQQEVQAIAADLREAVKLTDSELVRRWRAAHGKARDGG